MTDFTLQTQNLRQLLLRFDTLSREQRCLLLRLDFLAASQRGQAPSVESYLQTYPSVREDRVLFWELLTLELSLRDSAGEQLDCDPYVQRYPQFTAELEQHFATRASLRGDQSDNVAATGDEQETLLCADQLDDDSLSLPTLSPNAAPTQKAPSIPSDEIAGYEIFGELGRGGMGVIYKARQKGLNRFVALKMILHGDHAGAEARQRFSREAQSIAKLDHPNIVQIHEIGEHEDKPYFSLELISGGTLDQRLDGSPMEGKPAAKLVETLARAVHFAHQHGVVHRDLKPGNVLMTETGVPKISDFGLAKELGDAAQTQSGTIMGTPSYLAPEQAMGKSSRIGPKSDVYSLGAILYHLLTGRPPFKAGDVMSTLQQVLEQEPISPRRFNPRLSRDLTVICLKCLEKSPGKRYESAQELAEDLRRFQAGEPIVARPVSKLERGWRWCRRKPVLASLIGVSVSALVALVVLSTSVAVQKSRYADQQANSAREQKTANDKLRQLAGALRGERDRADLSLKSSRRISARWHLENAQRLCLQNEVDVGLHRYLQALSQATEEKDLDRIIRCNLSLWSRHLPVLVAPLEHPGKVRRVAFSADGRKCLTAAENGITHVWDVPTTSGIRLTLKHEQEVTAALFSPDSTMVLTASKDGTARLWDVSTGKQRGPVLRHDGAVEVAAWSPDGGKILTGGADKVAQLWEAATGKSLGPAIKHLAPISAVAFSPDGQTILTASTDGNGQLRETATGKTIGKPLTHWGAIYAVDFSPDGTMVATGGFDKTARIWDGKTGKLQWTLSHNGTVLSLAFGPHGMSLLTGADDNRARLWSATQGTLRRTRYHNRPVTSVCFSPDGFWMLTGSFDQTAQLWETTTGRSAGAPLRHNSYVYSVAFSPDGRYVLSGGGDGARLWQVPQEMHLSTPMHHRGKIYALARSPDGKAVATGGDDRTVRLWDVEAAKLLGPPLQHKGIVEAIVFSRNGSLVATACTDGTAHVWNVAKSEPVCEPMKHSTGVVRVALSPDAKTIATVCRDSDVRLWDVATGKMVGKPLHHEKRAVDVDFSPDGKMIVTACLDAKAHLWSAATREPVGNPLEHDDSVWRAIFSPDGKTVATCGVDSTARLWSVATGKLTHSPLRHRGAVGTMAFSPTGDKLLTGSYDGLARVWSTATGELLGEPLRHVDRVSCVAFSPDGKTIVTGEADFLARCWDVATGQLLGPQMMHRGPLTGVVFSRNGNWVLTAATDGALRRWRAPSPLGGGETEIAQWVGRLTGLEHDATGALVMQNAQKWMLGYRQLKQRGTLPADVEISNAPTPELGGTTWLGHENPKVPTWVSFTYERGGKLIARDREGVWHGTWKMLSPTVVWMHLTQPSAVTYTGNVQGNRIQGITRGGLWSWTVTLQQQDGQSKDEKPAPSKK